MRSTVGAPTLRTIGEVAEACGLPAHVLRHWDHMGLVRPSRDHSGRRLYTEDDLERIAVIVFAKQADLGLEALGRILDADHATRHERLAAHRRELDRRIADLQHARDLTARAVEHVAAGDAGACAAFEESIVQTVLDRTPSR